MWKFLNSPACRVNPYGCKSKIKLEQFRLEIQYVIKVFCAIYKKCLTAIDHIDYHLSQIQNTTRIKRSEEYGLYGHYHTHTQKNIYVCTCMAATIFCSLTNLTFYIG